MQKAKDLTPPKPSFNHRNKHHPGLLGNVVWRVGMTANLLLIILRQFTSKPSPAPLPSISPDSFTISPQNLRQQQRIVCWTHVADLVGNGWNKTPLDCTLHCTYFSGVAISHILFYNLSTHPKLWTSHMLQMNNCKRLSRPPITKTHKPYTILLSVGRYGAINSLGYLRYISLPELLLKIFPPCLHYNSLAQGQISIEGSLPRTRWGKVIFAETMFDRNFLWTVIITYQY